VSSSCSGKVVESSFHIGPYEFNADLISDINTCNIIENNISNATIATPQMSYFMGIL
jgi:hypothetical protein